MSGSVIDDSGRDNYKYYRRGMALSHVLQVRLSPDDFARLDELRRERHLNISAWARHVLLAALKHDFPQASTTGAAAGAARESGLSSPPAPLRGWHPAKLPGGAWGAAIEGPSVGKTHAAIAGRQILVTDRKGGSWPAAVLQVVEHTDNRVLARTTPRPRKEGRKG